MAAVCSSSLFRRLRPGLPAAAVLATAVLATALTAAPSAGAGTA
ncbi:glucanase, partial [Micromonospora aurantiaca]|nr:glucanase [Micromonospora aurantiaca]